MKALPNNAPAGVLGKDVTHPEGPMPTPDPRWVVDFEPHVVSVSVSAKTEREAIEAAWRALNDKHSLGPLEADLLSVSGEAQDG